MIAQTLLASNVYFWREAGYFAQAAEVKPLLHTWSLAVEEQFYLLLPLLLIAIARFSRKSLAPVILLLCGISLSLSVYCSYRHPSVNFYLLPTRAWELLLGSFLAAIPAHRAFKRWQLESMSWAGVLAILCAVFAYDGATRFPGVAAVLPCGGAALIIWANGHTLTSVGQLLSTRPIVFVGLISYSLYLWHWPLLVFFKYWALNPITSGQRMLLLLASMVLAVLSWKFVETPFRRRVLLKSRVHIFTFASITTVVLLLTGLAIHKLEGLASRIPLEALRYADGVNETGGGKNVGLKSALNGDFLEFGKADKHLPIRLFVWGDSHAGTLMPVLDVLGKEHAIRGVLATHSSTPPLVNFTNRVDVYGVEECIAYQNAIVDFIRSRRVSEVILVAAWARYLGPISHNQLNRGLIDTIRALNGTDTRVWIMKQVPEYPWPVPKALARAVISGRNLEELELKLDVYQEQLLRQEPIFEGLVSQFPRPLILDPTKSFMSERMTCRVAEGGRALYTDNHHLSVTGAMLLRSMLDPVFEEIGKSPAPLK